MANYFCGALGGGGGGGRGRGEGGKGAGTEGGGGGSRNEKHSHSDLAHFASFPCSTSNSDQAPTAWKQLLAVSVRHVTCNCYNTDCSLTIRCIPP